MHYRAVAEDRSFLVRLTTGRDWRAQLEALADREEIAAGWMVGLGAVRSAELWYYDQHDGEYRSFTVDEPMEVASFVGNLSLLDGQPFAHTHAVLSDREGRCIGGHLHRAETFAGEVYVRTFEEPLERAHDRATDLDLWDIGDGT